MFHEIAEETLKDINTQLVGLATRPKKLRVKYVDDVTVEGQKI